MKLNKEVKAVIFDYDGVLVDSVDIGFVAHGESVKACGKEAPATKEEFQEEMVKPYMVILKNLGITKKNDLERAHNAYKKIKMERSNEIKLVPGIKEVLERLSRKYRLAIASGTMVDIINERIASLGIKKYFEVVLGKEHHKNPKPAPELLETCIKRLKINPEEAIFVGDMVVDIQMGKAAGVKTIILCSHSWNKKETILNNHPDMLLESVEQLCEVL